VRYVTGGYFQALGIPVLRGRALEDQDRAGSQPMVVIDENLAKQYWPNENPVGKHLGRGQRGQWSTIVGVVGHVKHSDLAGDTGKGVIYYSLFQQAIPYVSIVVKTAGDPAGMAGIIREAVRSADPSQPVHTLKTLPDMVAASLATRRFAVSLLGFFAATALLMAAIGLYGVIGYSVGQRTQEMGIRMALGAARGEVLGMIIAQGLRMTAAGLVIGIAAALALTRLVSSQLFGITPFDPLTFAVAALVLLTAALAASYFPARRATRVDPMTALRYE
jgi:predicted permease